MCASERPILRRASGFSLVERGFSLVELMVAMVLTGLLMAGMYQIFKANASQFVNAHETLGIQRNARWGLALLQDDVLQAGYLMPSRVVTELLGNAQPPIKIETTTTALKYKDSKYGEIDAGAPDDIQIVMDIPLGADGAITAATQYGTELKVNIPAGGEAVSVGDVAFVQDSIWEMFRIGGISNVGTLYTITIDTAPDTTLSHAFALNPMVVKPHRVGAPVAFYRPLQVVRYTLRAVALDPSDASATVPCLIRESKALAAGAFGNTEVLLEGVTAFKLDWSLDGGKTWIRRANTLMDAQWAAIKAATNGVITGSSNRFTKQLPGGMANTVDPLWFNYIPVTLKIDVETRTRAQRTEYNAQLDTASPEAKFRTRRETLLISPRNFSLGAPTI